MNFPTKCPYCEKDIIQNRTTRTNDASTKGGRFVVEVHRCIHCSRPIFILIEQVLDGQILKDKSIIHCFPIKAINPLSKKIQELSPKAYQAYEDAIQAESQGFTTLVGVGLRIALEWIVWDYLIKVKNYTEKQLTNDKLVDLINKMEGNFYMNVCATLVRIFGNDSVHIRKQTAFSIEEASTAFVQLCGLIESELKIQEINTRLPPANQQKRK